MARSFASASSQLLQSNTVVIASTPFTVAGWFTLASLGSNRTLWSVATNGSDNHYFKLGLSSGDAASFRARDTANSDANSSNSVALANTWNHLCGISNAANDRKSYLNGNTGSRGTNGTTRNPAGMDRTTLGGKLTGSNPEYQNGLMAEWAVWDTNLSEAEVVLLSTGFSPLLVRPENIVAYWPLFGRNDPETDLFGRLELTLTNAPTNGDHVRLIRPRPPRFTTRGVPTISGSADSVITKTAQALSGNMNFVATITSVTTKTAQAAAGNQYYTGTAASVITKTAQAASGTQGPTGTAASVIGKTVQSATGTHFFAGTAASVIPKTVQVLAGSYLYSGTAASVVGKTQEALVGNINFIATITSVTTKTAQALAGNTGVSERVRYVNTASTAGGNGTTNATSGANRAYATLNEAIVEEETDLVAANVKLTIICEGSDPDTASVTIDDFTTSSTCYVHIKTSEDGRHAGKWNTAKYRHEAAYTGFDIGNSYTVVEGLQILAGTGSDDNGHKGINVGATARDVVIRENIIRLDLAAQVDFGGGCSGIHGGTDRVGNIFIINNLIYDFDKPTNVGIIVINHDDDGNTFAYHNTIVDCTTGITDGYNDIIAKNNLVYSCGTAFSGALHGDSDYNVTDAGSAPGSNSKTSQTITFVNAGSDDFHSSDTDLEVANNLYADSDYAVTIDIDGEDRPSSGDVYAGGDEPSNTVIEGAAASVIGKTVQALAGNSNFIGTISQTTPKTTQALAGTHFFLGTAASVIGKTAQALAGSYQYVGTAASVTTKTAQAAAGNSNFIATITQTTPKTTQAAAGTHFFAGTAASVIGKTQQSASGSYLYTGTAASVIPKTAQAASGNQYYTATATSVIPKTTQAATGVQGFVGLIVQTTPKVTQAAAGSYLYTGTAASVIGKTAQALTGNSNFVATITSVIPKTAQAAVAFQGYIGQAASVIPKTAQAAAGSYLYSGTAASVIGKTAQAASGNQVYSGTAASVTRKTAQAASGNQYYTATITQTTPKVIQAASGNQVYTATITSVTTKTAQAAAGSYSYVGQAASVIGKATQAAVGSTSFSGTAASVTQKTAQAATGNQYFIGTAGSVIGKAAQAAVGSYQYVGTAASVLRIAQQALVGTIRISGTIIQVIPSTRQQAFAIDPRIVSVIPRVTQAAYGTLRVLKPVPHVITVINNYTHEITVKDKSSSEIIILE